MVLWHVVTDAHPLAAQRPCQSTDGKMAAMIRRRRVMAASPPLREAPEHGRGTRDERP